jgi:transcriptional antiterminator RfaH
MQAAVIATSVVDTRPVGDRLVSAGYRIFIPTYVREIRHARRVELRVLPLFSRYLFCWMHSSDVGNVRRVRGVADVLRRAGSLEPAFLPQAALDCLLTVSDADLKLGEMLRVCRGRWDGLQGLFMRREEERVILMISMLGKDVELSVPAAHVTKAA